MIKFRSHPPQHPATSLPSQIQTTGEIHQERHKEARVKTLEPASS